MYHRILAYAMLMMGTVLTSSTQDSVGSRDCICFQEHINDIYNAISMASIIHVPGTFLVAEQHGIVWEIDTLTSSRKVFLNITHKVFTSKKIGEERGLLGLAVPKNYQDSRNIFTCYSFRENDTDYLRVSRFDSVKKETVLLSIQKNSTRSIGGMILFGTDDYLYVTVGDDRQPSVAQTKNKFLGKILRLDVSTAPKTNKAYSVAKSNPFINDTSLLEEIYALGFSNPWRCSVDAGDRTSGRGRGRIYCSDTGEDDYDEINLIKSGRNYGWDLKEGEKCIGNVTSCANIEKEELPIFTYDHVGKPAALVGGYVYRGSENPHLQGKYMFGEALTGSFMSLYKENNRWIKKDVEICPPLQCDSAARALPLKFLLAFATDHSGEHYAVMTNQLQPTTKGAKIFKIVAKGSGAGLLTTPINYIFATCTTYFITHVIQLSFLCL